MASDALLSLIEARKARVGIIGLGYVGLPLAVEFARAGFRVEGFDLSKETVKRVNAGRSHIGDVPSEAVAAAVEAKKLHATADVSRLTGQDVVIVCVPTPLRKSKEPDVSYILAAVAGIAKHLRKGQLVILESTTYPGTTEELVLPELEATGLRCGADFFLAFSPERVDPANPRFTIRNTPKVVGGVGAKALKLAVSLYDRVVERVVPVSSPRAAEMTKLLENTFRAVNIGLINEFALQCHKLGVDVWEVIEAAKTKPFGFMSFLPGPGLGGHCIPVDPQYLAWKMRSLNLEPRFIELAGVVNARMPEYVVQRVGAMLNTAKKPLRGAKILLVGITYKPDVADLRESPALDVFKLLQDAGAALSYHDRFVPECEFLGRRYRSMPLSRANVRAADVVIILTAHAGVDYAAVVRAARRVFDTRNATAGLPQAKVEKL